MTNAISVSVKRIVVNRAGGLLLAGALLGGVAQAQTAPSASPPGVIVTKGDASNSLTWNGITLYGIIDIGFQYQTHGVAISDYFPAGSESIISKNSSGSVTGLTPNNLSQSRIGLSGLEPIANDFSFVFRLETFFNPQSGNLSDALKSITLNNGRPLTGQSTNVDSSVAGQLFAGAAYAGFTSPTLGTLTFGRHVTPLADGIAKYDPMGAAQAFSVIGFSGTAGGGGDTEDRRLDDSVKYTAKYSFLHLAALYQFSGASGGSGTAAQGQIGADFLGGGSIDGYYAKKRDAVAASALSAEQMGEIGALGYSSSNSVVGTVADTTTYGAMALYSFGAPKIYAGYEHIKFENPKDPLDAGSSIIGGYVLAFVNNNAYGAIDGPATPKTLQVLWAGGKYAFTPNLEATIAWYGYRQDAYAVGADAGCNNALNAKCKGQLNAISGLADYKFTKRLDGYLGTMWSQVQDGLANGYLQLGPSGSASTITTTAGVRFKF